MQTAFEKATNFEPQIITKQSINSRKIHKVNHIDIGHEDEIEINEAHVRNPNYKGKNDDLNFTQNRLKATNNNTNTSNNQNNTTPSYGLSGQHSNNNLGYGYSKSNQQEKPVNVSVTLHGPVSQRSNAYHQLHQKPDEALQSYNTRYASFFNLAYPELELDNPLSRMHCIHYASSLYGKLGDEMTGRFN